MEEHQLEGLWTYTACEVGGVELSPEKVARMAKLVLLPGDHVPGWNGLWAVATYGYAGGKWSEEHVKARSRHIILGSQSAGGAPESDFYLWAGGRFRTAPLRSSKEIDLEQFWMGMTIERSMQLGLYKLNSEQLTLCVADAGNARPTAFSSREHLYQSLGQLVRWLRTEKGARPDVPNAFL